MLQLNYRLLRHFISIVLLIVFSSATGSAQSIIKKINDLINAYRKLEEFNGCILVAQNGNIIF